MNRTLFEKIAAREIPAAIVYEDESVLGIRDIHPQAPTHLLVFPKRAIPRIAEATPEDAKVLAHLLLKAAEVAEKAGLTKEGYRLVINNGPNGGETIPHLHVHVLGGRQMQWPPG
jgi:histidine triad (HIT) family protein